VLGFTYGRLAYVEREDKTLSFYSAIVSIFNGIATQMLLSPTLVGDKECWMNQALSGRRIQLVGIILPLNSITFIPII